MLNGGPTRAALPSRPTVPRSTSLCPSMYQTWLSPLELLYQRMSHFFTTSLPWRFGVLRRPTCPPRRAPLWATALATYQRAGYPECIACSRPARGRLAAHPLACHRPQQRDQASAIGLRLLNAE